ncbi:MAG: LCP family protein, partial [Parasporobacterium sp.]|nr:LCP family protein [Parasporobacterium sp.]
TKADEAFLVFISGNDSEGEISLTGRSDVDIVAGVNPASHQVLLLTIPRDYYVEIPGITGEGSRDKLTHSGIYGMDALLATVENLLGTEINYYVRLNFSSMINIVDAMGGVVVDVEKDFISHGGIDFKKGPQLMDGDKTLHYVRERYAFEDGDFARGRHQVQVIQAMLNKLMSVNTLANYNNLADAIVSFAATNIPQSVITSVIRDQLDKNPQWHIVTYQLLGDIMMQPCQSANGQYLSVDMPYKESVENAKILLKQLLNGEVLSEDLQLVDNGQLTYVVAPVE